MLNWRARLQNLTWTVDGDTVVLTDRLTTEDLELLRKMKETKISFLFNDQPGNEVVEYLGTAGNINICLDPRYYSKTITLTGVNDTLEEVVRTTVGALELGACFHHGVLIFTDAEGMKRLDNVLAVPFFPEKPSKEDLALQKRLRETVVSFVFNEQPIPEVFEYLGTVGNVNLVLDRRPIREDATVSLKLTNVSLETALDLLYAQIGVTRTVHGGVVVISDRKTVERWHAATSEVPIAKGGEKDEKNLALRKILLETKISFVFQDQTVKEGIEYLAGIAKFNLVWDPAVKLEAGRVVTLKLTNVGVATALQLLLDQGDLACEIRDGKVVIINPPKPEKPEKPGETDKPGK